VLIFEKVFGKPGLSPTVRQRLRLYCGFIARAVSDEFVPGNKSTGSFQKLTAKVLEISSVPILR
jgi:hypothetical protein